MIAGVILAAGEGRRFGGPKALARVGGDTWLARAILTLGEAGLLRIVIVIGAESESVRSEPDAAAAIETLQALDPAEPITISWVVNPVWREGRTGSVILGLRDLPEAARGAVLYPVDFPFVSAATPAALVAASSAIEQAEGKIFLPVHAGRRGHPILLGRAVWPEVFALLPDTPLNTVVRRDPRRVIEVPVPDAGIHRNVNRPED